MIKQQIETMLNIKGKDMPSVEEEFGSGGIILLHPFEQLEHRFCISMMFQYIFIFAFIFIRVISR